MVAEESTLRRSIRSFVRREGRITQAQRRALEELLPVYRVDPDIPLIEVVSLFGREVPTIIEVGFGDGDNLLRMAADQPECNFIGIEVYRPGLGRLLLRLRELGLGNLKVVDQDAAEVIAKRLLPESIDKLLVFFPDPWPKKRHHKRRLVQSTFIAQAVNCLKIGGQIHIATDWRDYAEQMLKDLSAEPRLRNTAAQSGYAVPPNYRLPTKYENRGKAQGHLVWDLIFERIG